MTAEEFTLTNLELRESTDTGEVSSGLSHQSMAGLFLLQVRELAADGVPRGAVTIVHDAGDHGGRYLDVARDLAKAGWAVALPDMRGHGGTEGDRGHCGGIAEAVRDLQAIQDHLAYRMPDAPKVIVGQGLGALWGAAHAMEQRGTLAALVLLSPLHHPRFELPSEPAGVKRLFKKHGPRTAGSTGYRPNFMTTDGQQALAWQNDPHTHEVITVRAAEQAREAAETYLPQLATAGVPVLVMHGSDDPISSWEKSRALESDAIEVRVFEGLRHSLLHETQASEVRSALVHWLGQVGTR